MMLLAVAMQNVAIYLVEDEDDRKDLDRWSAIGFGSAWGLGNLLLARTIVSTGLLFCDSVPTWRSKSRQVPALDH